MLLSWAWCAQCERRRATAIRADEFFEKSKNVSRQPSAVSYRRFTVSLDRKRVEHTFKVCIEAADNNPASAAEVTLPKFTLTLKSL
jgi:hypothetical protein